jgi:hypothetical protein
MVADFVFDGVCLGEKPILRGPENFNSWGERSAWRKCFTRAVPAVT